MMFNVPNFDSHADTCCFRSGALIILEDLSQCDSVSGFLLSMKKKKERQVGSVAVAYNDPALQYLHPGVPPGTYSNGIRKKSTMSISAVFKWHNN